MKYISILLLLAFLILPINYAYAYSDDFTNLFINAKRIELSSNVQGSLALEYDVDSFVFTAPKTGYYSFLGTGEHEFRGHLYNSEYQFMRTGDTFREDNIFFIVAYLQKNESVYLKVDSTLRESQNYKVGVGNEILPFNQVKPYATEVETYINPNEVKTVKIPLSFYNNNKDVGYISKAYTYLMQIKSEGIIQGQAGFNTETYNLELDIYGETDAVLNISLGGDISCKVAIKAVIQESVPDYIPPDSTDQDDNDNGYEPPQPQDPSPIEKPTGTIRAGDCNLDNIVNINDVTSLLDVNELSQFNQHQFGIADVTGNGIVDFTDALIILRRVTGAKR